MGNIPIEAMIATMACVLLASVSGIAVGYVFGLTRREKNARQEYANRLADLRDNVLHERHQLAEAGLDNYQVNAVLGLIDDAFPELQEPHP